MSLLGKLLTTVGLGQSDLKQVFNQTIEKLGKMDFATADMRKGQRQAIQVMLDVLRDGDVMESDTKRELEENLEKAYRA